VNLRLPESGSLLESLLSGLGKTVAEGTGDTVADVTAAQVTQALDALVRGDVEYVILEDGDAFLQAAGDGPFMLQHNNGDGSPMIAVSGGVDEKAMRAAFASYLRGDAGWRTAGAWQPM